MRWTLALYAALVLGIALWRRRHPSADQYLMGERNASAFLVAAALFTLVGGGELVTLAALAFSFGFGALTLFLGYAGGFVFLAWLAPRIRALDPTGSFVSLPDYCHARFGSATGRLSFLVSFGAFFALLVVQFIAAGTLLAPLLDITYQGALLTTGTITLAYLIVGGFDTVLLTDVLQAASRLLLVPLLLVASRGGQADILSAAAQPIPGALALSLTVTGFFAASSSADVWQRIYAARSAQSARAGLLGGAIALLFFGALLVGVGLIAAGKGLTDDPNQAFAALMLGALPGWAAVTAIVLVLMTVMSTADTEMFLTGGMLVREIERSREGATTGGLGAARAAVAGCSLAAMALALWVTDLVQVYTWLIASLLVLAPMVLGSLITDRDRVAGPVSLVVSAFAFLVLALAGAITPETAYFVLMPGFLVYFIALVARPVPVE